MYHDLIHSHDTCTYYLILQKMTYGICNLSIVPCRREPSDRSEMVTQLLFGDHFEVLETQGSWCRIKIAYDSYECWVDKKQFLPIQEPTFDILNATEIFC